MMTVELPLEEMTWQELRAFVELGSQREGGDLIGQTYSEDGDVVGLTIEWTPDTNWKAIP